MDVSAIRELLNLGETARALDALTALLKPDKRFKTALRTVELAAAKYHTVRKKEGFTISPEEARLEYGRIHDKLLDVLDDLEAGRTRAPGGESNLQRYWPAGAAALALAVFAGWYFWPSPAPADTAQQAAWQRANQTHTIPAYREFLDQYKTDSLAAEARDSLAGLQKRLDYWLHTAEAHIIGEEPDGALQALDTARRIDPSNPEITRLTNRLAE